MPLHPPEAVHEVALEEDHVTVDVPPGAMVLGAALNVTLGPRGIGVFGKEGIVIGGYVPSIQTTPGTFITYVG